ncbi:hypothetical protein TSH64_15190 [Azospirillum sp. TSH64]|nr:hypothetical protein TSH64_15190 [Azospirillum sp. TSH64]
MGVQLPGLLANFQQGGDRQLQQRRQHHRVGHFLGSERGKTVAYRLHGLLHAITQGAGLVGQPLQILAQCRDFARLPQLVKADARPRQGCGSPVA